MSWMMYVNQIRNDSQSTKAKKGSKNKTEIMNFIPAISSFFTLLVLACLFYFYIM